MRSTLTHRFQTPFKKRTCNLLKGTPYVSIHSAYIHSIKCNITPQHKNIHAPSQTTLFKSSLLKNRLYCTIHENSHVLSVSLDLIEQHEHAKAIEKLLSFVDIDAHPSRPPPSQLIEAFELLSRAYCEIEDFNSALKYADSIFLLDPNSYHGFLAKSEVYRQLEDFPAFEEYVMRAYQLNPRSLRNVETLAYEYYIVGNYEKSVAIVNQIIQDDPANYMGWTLLSANSLRLGDIESSETCFQNAISIDSSRDDIFREMGLIYFDTGQTQKGIDMLEKAYTLNPNHRSTIVYLAMALGRSNQESRAISMLKQLLQRRPHEVGAMVLVAEFLIKLGEHDEAERYIDHAIQLDTSHFVAHYLKGVIKFHSQSFEDAIDSLQKAVSINPEYVEAYDLLCLILFQEGRVEEGLSILEKGVGLDKGDPSSVQSKGSYTLANLNRLLEGTLEHYPGHEELRVTLANEYYKVGQMDALKEILQPLIESDEENPFLRKGTCHEDEDITTSLCYLTALLLKFERYDEAGGLLYHIQKENPQDNRICILFIKFFIAVKRYEDALEMINKIPPSEGFIDEHMAQWKNLCLEKLGSVNV